MEYEIFKLSFVNSHNREVYKETIAAWDHFDACEYGLSKNGEGVCDFQVTSLPFSPDAAYEVDGIGPMLSRWMPKSVEALKANARGLLAMVEQQQRMLQCVAPILAS